MRRGIESKIQHNVSLASLTTIGLGGPAKYFIDCHTVDDIVAALEHAEQTKVRLHVLSGGSNTVFADQGFDGLVVKISLKGVTFVQDGQDVVATVAAGEDWDSFVAQCVERNLAGVECLSGIPGSVGATPIQNVGAYGQDVAATIVSVATIRVADRQPVNFTNQQCNFGYRRSRFKYEDAGQYIVTAVRYRLVPSGPPTLKYAQLIEKVGGRTAGLAATRQAVLELRRGKSMVIDQRDPHSRSCGSFFMNVVLTADQLQQLQGRISAAGIIESLPVFPEGEHYKVPAAWLIQQAGFRRGQRFGDIGISPKHTLALVNYGGTTAQLMTAVAEIVRGVQEKFGITLAPEPVIVS